MISPMDDASNAWRDLRDALQDAGIHLPSLYVDPPTLPGGQPAIHLGRVNVATARKLIDVVKVVSTSGGPEGPQEPAE